MGKIIFALFFLSVFSVSAQDEQKSLSDFSFGFNFTLGNSMLNTEEFRNLNGSILMAQIDFSYDLLNEKQNSSFWRFSLGLEVATYNANLFSGIGQSSLWVEYIRVPFKVEAIYRLGNDENGIFSNTKAVTGLGGFINYVYKYEVSNLQSTTDLDDVDLGLGYLFNLGLEQDVSGRFSIVLGLDYSLMGDKNKSDLLNFNTMAFYLGTRYRL